MNMQKFMEFESRNAHFCFYDGLFMETRTDVASES